MACTHFWQRVIEVEQFHVIFDDFDADGQGESSFIFLRSRGVDAHGKQFSLQIFSVRGDSYEIADDKSR